jgi:hypothetical protein
VDILHQHTLVLEDITLGLLVERMIAVGNEIMRGLCNQMKEGSCDKK